MAKGHPRAHFQHAIERGDLLSAQAAAQDLGGLALADALELLLLIAKKDQRRFERARSPLARPLRA